MCREPPFGELHVTQPEVQHIVLTPLDGTVGDVLVGDNLQEVSEHLHLPNAAGRVHGAINCRPVPRLRQESERSAKSCMWKQE